MPIETRKGCETSYCLLWSEIWSLRVLIYGWSQYIYGIYPSHSVHLWLHSTLNAPPQSPAPVTIGLGRLLTEPSPYVQGTKVRTRKNFKHVLHGLKLYNRYLNSNTFREMSYSFTQTSVEGRSSKKCVHSFFFFFDRWKMDRWFTCPESSYASKLQINNPVRDKIRTP